MILKFKAIYALTRIKEYFDFNFTLCLLALAISGKTFSWLFLAIVLANLFGLAFAFMINDVEDAEEDATDPQKLKRNPIANRTLSRQEGYFFTNLGLVIALALYFVISLKSSSPLPLLCGLLLLVFDFLYSYRKIRLKNFPILDLISHSYMLAGGQFLVTYFAYEHNLTLPALIAFLAVVAFSMYGELENELKDFVIDVRTKINTTAIKLGKKLSQFLQILLVFSAVCGVIYVFWSQQITFTILINILLLYLVLFSYPVIKFLLTKDRSAWKTDVHRAVLLSSNIVLVVYIVNFNT